MDAPAQGRETASQQSACQVAVLADQLEEQAGATRQLSHTQRGTFKGGYDCEFVERPTDVFQTECSICLEVLREPHIISCCGHSFCGECINETKQSGKNCPLCNEPKFTLMHNKGLERSLKELEVHCIHQSLGCEWTGKLGTLDNHLNVEPELEKQQEGCEYAEVKCIHDCGEYFRRPLLANHQADECLKRPFSCDFCHEYSSTYEDVVGKHFPVCLFYQVPCPNYCTPYTFERQNLEAHLKTECPLQVVDCNFAHAGCKAKLLRKEMPSHLKENIEHLTLLANLTQNLTSRVLERDAEIERLQNKVFRLRLDFGNEIEKCRAEIRALQEECQELRVDCANQIQHVPVKRILTNFEELKVHDKEWFSEPFYSHPQGYKMCLNVCVNGFGRHKGTHISVFVYFVKGEYDNTLLWPFRGIITIEVLNRLEDTSNHSHAVLFDHETPSDCAERVLCGPRAPHGWGTHKFISNEKLSDTAQGIQYVCDDCLHFRVSRVELTIVDRTYTTM